jgi:hypothetical protein
MECQICFEHFDSTSFVPKVLTKCGHSFCKICLERLQFQKSHITCPVCRDHTKITKKEILPTNYSLIEVIENHKHDTLTKGVLEKYKYFGDKSYQHINPTITRCSEPKKLNLKKIINDDFIYVEEFENNQNISIFSNLTKRNRRYCFNRHSWFSYLFNEYSYSILAFRKASKCKHSFSCLETILRRCFYSACFSLIIQFPLKKLFEYLGKNSETVNRFTFNSQVGVFGTFALFGVAKCLIAYYIDEILKFK